MSADFELCQNLPKIRLTNGTDTNRSPINLRENNTEEEEENTEFDCHTPISEENRIPKILSCPPAPRKPRRRGPSCKRKLKELQFFEIVNGDEIEGFFRSSFQQLARKRRSRICP